MFESHEVANEASNETPNDSGSSAAPKSPARRWSRSGGKATSAPAGLRGALALGVLATGGLGYVLGHDLSSPGSSTAAASAVGSASTPANGSSSASSPNDSTGSGTGSSAGTPASGSSAGTPASGSSAGTPASGSSGIGSGLGFGASVGYAPGSASNAAGAPPNAAALAKAVDTGLVDINTTLNYVGQRAAGTGMVLTSSGLVLTNNHVIEGATSISVTDVGNGKTYAATVVGYDHTQDVAVLRLRGASGLATITPGRSAAVLLHAAVVGVGNAGGVGGVPSYAGGAVTGLHQSVTASDGGTAEHLSGLLETNAAIRPGDSGGPLVDNAGQVVGMDTAGSIGSGGFAFQGSVGTGYAIPITMALRVAHRIEAGSRSALIHVGPTAFLGILVDSGPPAGSASGAGGQATAPAGATITQVITGASAARAGLVGGDTITSLAGHAVTSPAELSTLMTQERAGATVPVGYVDATGVAHTVTVHLGSGPPQ